MQLVQMQKKKSLLLIFFQQVPAVLSPDLSKVSGQYYQALNWFSIYTRQLNSNLENQWEAIQLQFQTRETSVFGLRHFCEELSLLQE